MKNAGGYLTCAFLVGLTVLARTPVRGQESRNVPSLGETARRLKAERKKVKQKPVAVFTNDDIPSRGLLGIATVNPGESPKVKGQAAARTVPSATPAEERGKNYFRSKAEKIHSRMDLHQRQLAILKQQLGLASMQYYPDPQKTLEQESTPAFQTDVNKLRTKISNAEKAISEDQKALEDLQTELRREGGDPGWVQ